MNNVETRHGTGVWIRKEGKLLLGKRISPRGHDTWCPPGGHVEKDESVADCCAREVREEAQLEIENLREIKVMEDLNPEINVIYITHIFVADWKSGEVIAKPDEFSQMGWYGWNALPQPLFRPTAQFVELGINPLEF